MSNKVHMSISIPSDNEGYILLKCEYCGTFFKVTALDGQDDNILHIFCPSCGLVSESYITEDILELAKKMAKNYILDQVYNTFKKREKHTKKDMVQLRVMSSFEYETEDPIRSGIEAMEVCVFPCCSRTAKIKPLLKMTGAYCPFCGVKNYEIE